MSDVVWAAAIAGGVGLVGNVATMWATALQRRSMERVEQVRSTAERERFEDELHERDRLRRLETYEELLQALDAVHRFGALGGAAKDFPVLGDRYRTLRSRVQVLGSDGVINAMAAWEQVLLRTSDDRQTPEAILAASDFRADFASKLDELRECVRQLREAMRADVARSTRAP